METPELALTEVAWGSASATHGLGQSALLERSKPCDSVWCPDKLTQPVLLSATILDVAFQHKGLCYSL